MRFRVKNLDLGYIIGDDALDEAEVFLTSQTKKFILAKVNKEEEALLHDYLLKNYKG